MKDVKAIANELEASTVGLNKSKAISWGSGSIQTFVIMGTTGCKAFNLDEPAGETGTWNENNGFYEGNTFWMECSFLRNGNEGHPYYFYTNTTTGFNINTPISVYATTNWTLVTTPSFMPDMGTVIFTRTDGSIKGCTKTRALAFGCSLQRATSYTDKQLVRYEDLYNSTSSMYPVTIKNSAHIELAVNGATYPVQQYNAGKTLTITGLATGSYRIKAITAVGTYDSTKTPTIKGSNVTMPAYAITVSCTEEAGVQCVVKNPEGCTISVNGNTTGLYSTTSGTTIKLTYTLTAGYTFNSWKITKDNGAATSFGATFTMPAYNLIISANVTAPKELDHDFVILNVPGTQGARFGYYNTSKEVPTVSQNALTEFKGIFDDEVAKVDGGTFHKELIEAAGYDADALCAVDRGDYFFLLGNWYLSVLVGIKGNVSVPVKCYHYDEATEKYTLLASGTIPYTDNSSNVPVAQGVLYINNYAASGTHTATVSWSPMETPSSIDDITSGNTSNLCDLMTFEYSDLVYVVGFNYFGCDVTNANNDEVVKFNSPILSLNSYLEYTSSSFTLSLEPTYAKTGNSRFANGLTAFYVPSADIPVWPTLGDITITIPTSLLELDYDECYFTMAMTQIPLDDKPIGCASTWNLYTISKNDGISVFDSSWVEYVKTNYSPFTDDEFSEYGLFCVPLTSLRDFVTMTKKDFSWFMSYELNSDNATITINLADMISYGYAGEWLSDTSQNNTLYISLIYLGLIYAWAYYPYNLANDINATVNDCKLTPTHIEASISSKKAGSDYELFDFATEDENISGLIIKQDAV